METIKGRYYGIYSAVTVGEVDTSKGTVLIEVSGVTGKSPKEARISHISGGTGGAAGIRVYPVRQSNCYVMFQNGLVEHPIIIGYSDALKAGAIGSENKTGSFIYRGPGGSTLNIDDINKTIKFITPHKFGLSVSAGELRLTHRAFELNVDDTTAEIRLPGGMLQRFENSEKRQLARFSYKNVHFKTGVYITESASRNDVVAGDWVLNSQNNLLLTAVGFNASGTDQVNISTKGFMQVGARNLTATIGNRTTIGSINTVSVFTNIGSVTLAAGATTTTAAASETGVLSAQALIDLKPIGTITITNNSASTTYNVGGSIVENSTLSKTATYGTSYSLTAGANVTFTTTGNYSLSSTAATINGKSSVLLDTQGALTISATQIIFKGAIPALGANVPTIFGLSPIIFT